jgi:transcriptional regulator with XRE-family HTH domain
MGEVRKTIGENIKKLCSLRGIKQVELAEHLNVSQGAVSNWIKGTNSIDIEKPAELCRYLGVSLDQIYGVAPIEADVTLSQDEASLLAMYRIMNDTGKKLLIDSAKAFSCSPNTQKENEEKKVI